MKEQSQRGWGGGIRGITPFRVLVAWPRRYYHSNNMEPVDSDLTEIHHPVNSCLSHTPANTDISCLEHTLLRSSFLSMDSALGVYIDNPLHSVQCP
jgi:hypothetical protein